MSGRDPSRGIPPSPKETFHKAIQLFRYGSFKKADVLLDNLLKLDGYGSNIYMMAIIFLETNHPDAAQRQLNPAMRIAPEAAALYDCFLS